MLNLLNLHIQLFDLFRYELVISRFSLNLFISCCLLWFFNCWYLAGILCILYIISSTFWPFLTIGVSVFSCWVSAIFFLQLLNFRFLLHDLLTLFDWGTFLSIFNLIYLRIMWFFEKLCWLFICSSSCYWSFSLFKPCL